MPFRLVPALITTVVLVTLLLILTPEGLAPKAWNLVAIFLTTIVAIVIVSLSQVMSNSSKGVWMKTDNTAESTAGRTPSNGTAYRAVSGATRRGHELEVSGEVARGWQLQGSYAMNSSSLNSSSRFPKDQFKVGTTTSSQPVHCKP